MRLRIGVSSCLLGSEVRFDGQHKRDAFLVDQLAPFVEWVPVCPEVEVGMGVPRESVRLVRRSHEGSPGPALIGNRTGSDWTGRMETFAAQRVARLDDEGLCGYVLKNNSPSCGMERVKLYAAPDAGASADRTGVGLFAAALLRRFPTLPVEEEGRLHDPRLRENFIERVFAYARLQALWKSPWGRGDLVAFHTAHKMALLAHEPEGYRALGRLVAESKTFADDELRARYEQGFADVMRVPATPGRHANVLEHMLGHLRQALDDGDRHELVAVIADYRNGLLPLVVPVTLMAHHVRRHSVAYLLGQTYLEPHPKELMLRNHV